MNPSPESETFRVVFSGQIIDGMDMGEVKAALAKEFKLNPESVDLLFSGKSVNIKKGLTKAQARDLARRFMSCWAVCSIEPEKQILDLSPVQSSTAPMGNPTLPMTRRLLGHLPQYLYIPGLYIDPDIPDPLLKNVRKCFGLESGKPFLGALDLTSDGSGEYFIAFCSRGLFYHSLAFERTRHGAIPWLDFARRQLTIGVHDQLNLDRNDMVDLANTGPEAFSVYQLLESIRMGLDKPSDKPLAHDIETQTKIVEAILTLFAPQGDLHLAPAIPETKEKNGRKVCGIPPHQPMIALVDCTVMGSAKNGLYFTSDSIYYSNDWTGKSRQGRILYSRLAERSFSSLGSFEISLGLNDTLVVSGATMKKEVFLDILESMARCLCD